MILKQNKSNKWNFYVKKLFKDRFMKKYLILFLILAFTSLSLDARIITVSNNPAIPAQYTNLQEAIDNADVGDTIFVHQSSTNYGNIVVNKKITLLGQGRNTILSSIFLSSVEGNQANNTSGTVVSEIGRAHV